MWRRQESLAAGCLCSSSYCMQDDYWRAQWKLAVDQALAQLVPYYREAPELAFTGKLSGGLMDPSLEHLACFWPGGLAVLRRPALAWALPCGTAICLHGGGQARK